MRAHGRLARARLADDRQRSTGRHREGDAVDGDEVLAPGRIDPPDAEDLAQVAHGQHGLRHRTPPPATPPRGLCSARWQAASGRAHRGAAAAAPRGSAPARAGSARETRTPHRRPRSADTGPARDRGQPPARVVEARTGAEQPGRVGMRGATVQAVRRRAVSTIRPAYMTAMRSHTDAARSRSWVMNSSASPRSRRCSSRIAITSSCVVTSSAVVGSSASSSRGSPASAAAIMTRCSRPPDSSCGYWRSRRCAVGDADLAQQAGDALGRGAPREPAACDAAPRSGSRRSVRTGLTCARGSWKTIATSRAPQPAQLRRRRARGRARRRAGPSLRLRAPAGSSRMIARAVIDLPEPDSPTSPSASPACSSSSTPWITVRSSPSDGQIDPQALDLQQRGRHATSSMRTRCARRSPTRLNETTATTITSAAYSDCWPDGR